MQFPECDAMGRSNVIVSNTVGTMGGTFRRMPDNNPGVYPVPRGRLQTSQFEFLSNKCRCRRMCSNPLIAFTWAIGSQGSSRTLGHIAAASLPPSCNTPATVAHIVYPQMFSRNPRGEDFWILVVGRLVTFLRVTRRVQLDDLVSNAMGS